MQPASDTVRLPSNRPRAWLLVAAAYAGGTVAYFVLTAGIAREFAYCLFGIGAALGIGYRALANPGDDRRGWLLLLTGVVLWTLGDTAWAFARIANPVKSSVEVADLLYIVGYVPIGLSILAFAHRRPSPTALLDTLILTCGAAVLMWAFVVSPELGTDTDIPGVLVATGYALGDLVLIAVAIRSLQVDGPWPPGLPLLIAGLLGVLVSDVLFVPIADAYQAGMLLDVGWIVSYGLWAAAAFVPDDLGARALVRGPFRDRIRRVLTRWRGDDGMHGRDGVHGLDMPHVPGVPLPLLLIAALLGPVSIAVTFGRGSERDVIVLGILSIMLVTLVVARLGTAIHEFRAAIVTAGREVDARRATEAVLRAERSRFNLLLDQLPIVVVATDRDLRITSLRGRNLVAPAEDTIGVPLPTFMEALDPTWRSTGAEARALAGESVRIEAPWMDRLYQVALEPYRDESGEVQGIVLISIDVTESRRLEVQLERARKMEALGLLAGGVAHDFNNVLTAIRGYSELVRDALPLADARRSDADEIVRASERAARLTQQLLAYSRGQVLRPEIIDPKDTMARVVPLLRRTIGEDIEVVAETAPDVRRIRADPGQLDQIVLNLAVNARDAMPAGGTITISAANVEVDDVWPGAWDGFEARAGQFVRLRVSDTGVGMAPEVRAHIFEPFFTTKRHGHGTGLGLATVYGVVRQSGGFVRVDSTPGEGSTFDVCLPVANAPEAADASTPQPHMTGSGRGATVAVVEDEGTIARLVASILERAGYRPMVFACADEAIGPLSKALAGNEASTSGTVEQAAAPTTEATSTGTAERATAARHRRLDRRSHRPAEGSTATAGGQSAGTIACLVTDVLMPGMKGPELATRLRAIRPELPIAFTSGYAGIDALPALDARTAFLPKPFTAAELLVVVERLAGTDAPVEAAPPDAAIPG